VRSRLLPHIVPAPSAMRINRMSVSQLTDPSIRLIIRWFAPYARSCLSGPRLCSSGGTPWDLMRI
jgi:hypothetical protein